jgi:hypothetical protein
MGAQLGCGVLQPIAVLSFVDQVLVGVQPRQRENKDPASASDAGSRSLGVVRLSRYGFVTASPDTVASVLCAKRIPYTPSVDLSFPAVTSADLS